MILVKSFSSIFSYRSVSVRTSCPAVPVSALVCFSSTKSPPYVFLPISPYGRSMDFPVSLKARSQKLWIWTFSISFFLPAACSMACFAKSLLIGSGSSRNRPVSMRRPFPSCFTQAFHASDSCSSKYRLHSSISSDNETICSTALALTFVSAGIT